MPRLIKELNVEEVVFSYSDVNFNTVMEKASLVLACGADFKLLSGEHTMIKSNKPVISVCAVRTGCGKSQTSRKIASILKEMGQKVVIIRHPMPYGDLEKQTWQRFASIEDMKKHECTIEEMEEYEPHITRGNIIYAGVDYEAILRAAEQDPDGCDVVLWDGGNNDFPFYKPDLNITVLDPHRAGHERSYYPGEVTLRLADVAVINKMDTASPENIQIVRDSLAKLVPDAIVIDAASPIKVDDPSIIHGKKVLVIEDGPTLTHGGMKLGAGTVAAHKFGAKELVDPRPFTVGKLSETFHLYPNIGTLLPAMGYSDQQLKDMETTINQTECDAVVIGTPIDLNRVIKINKPNTRVYYDLQEIGEPDLEGVLNEFVKKLQLK